MLSRAFFLKIRTKENVDRLTHEIESTSMFLFLVVFENSKKPKKSNMGTAELEEKMMSTLNLDLEICEGSV